MSSGFRSSLPVRLALATALPRYVRFRIKASADVSVASAVAGAELHVPALISGQSNAECTEGMSSEYANATSLPNRLDSVFLQSAVVEAVNLLVAEAI